MKARFPRYLNTLLFAAVLLLGVSVMLGWIVGIDLLVQVLPGLAPMQFNNALCFVLLGISGIAYVVGRTQFVLPLAASGLILSSLTLIQYLVNIDFGIDLLFMNTHEIIPTAHPGRMAPNSAIGHMLAFLSLLCLVSKNRVSIKLAGFLGALVLSTGIISLAGYFINVDGGYSWGRFTQMALHTSIGFVISGIALGLTILPERIKVEREKFNLWPYMVVILITVFLIDMQLPQGVAVGLLYVMPLLASWYFHNRKQIIVVAIICNGLIALDVLLATQSLESEAVFYNRIMSVLAVWVAASIFYYLKRISEQQKEADMKFKLAVQGTTAGIWDWVSVTNEHQWWSPQFYQLLGYKNQELPANLNSFKKVLHPDDYELTFKMVDRHFMKKTPFQVEYRLLHKTGKYKWFLGSGQATWNHEDQPVRMVGTIIDINARKLAEVAEQERTLQLAQKNRELEEFTYVASHDLQEPVRTISSFVNLFRETYADKLDEEANVYLDFMDGASKRSQQLIIDLLDYSRIGKERVTETVILKKVLENVMTDITVRIDEANATVTFDDNLPILQGQTTELRLLFQNLISNAIKFRKKNVDPIIHVGYSTSNDNHVFSISDNGIGIDEKYIDRIFVIFKRLHGKSEFEGTGIGLAHCKKVVELHGGKIWVKSELGKGSVFHFSIPMEQKA